MLEYVVGFIAYIYCYKYLEDDEEKGEEIERRFTNTKTLEN
tara:strand:+ start:674 stop:796 length:123 start_codon:yes stop_codon:yes gene_type:complete